MFNLAKKYNVRLSLITNPLALQAQGVRESLRELGRDIANLKEVYHLLNYQSVG